TRPRRGSKATSAGGSIPSRRSATTWGSTWTTSAPAFGHGKRKPGWSPDQSRTARRSSRTSTRHGARATNESGFVAGGRREPARVWGDPHERHAAASHALGREAVAVQRDFLAFLRDRPEDAEHEPADGVPTVVGKGRAEELVHLGERDGGVETVGSVAEGRHVRHLVLVLLGDVAHQLLDQVLERHHADDGPVLVDHHGGVEPLLLHLAQEVGGALRIRNEVRGPHE